MVDELIDAFEPAYLVHARAVAERKRKTAGERPKKADRRRRIGRRGAEAEEGDDA